MKSSSFWSSRIHVARMLMALLLGAVAGQPLHAQTYPTRQIVLVVGFGAGTGAAVGHVFAEFASRQLGQPVVVETRPGAGGVVAAGSVARSAPDGYTIALQAVGPMTLRPLMEPPVEYDPEKDFTPIAMFGDTPNIVLGGANLPAQNIKELVAWAKQNPGRLTIGHPGTGSMGHLAALLLAQEAGFTGTYVAYRNVGQMVTDLLGGHIDAGVAAYTPQHKAAHIMAVMTAERVDFLPDVPSMREAGFPGVYASTWFELNGPAGMPPEIVNRLNAVVNAFVRDHDARKRMAALGFHGIGGTPDDLKQKLASEKRIWSKVITGAHLTPGDK